MKNERYVTVMRLPKRSECTCTCHTHATFCFAPCCEEVEVEASQKSPECERCGGYKVIRYIRSLPGGFDENIEEDCPECVVKS